MTTPADWLRTIQGTARIIKWITEAPQGDQDLVAEACPNTSPENLAQWGRAYLALALRRLEEQEQQ